MIPPHSSNNNFISGIATIYHFKLLQSFALEIYDFLEEKDELTKELFKPIIEVIAEHSCIIANDLGFDPCELSDAIYYRYIRLPDGTII